MSSTYTAGNVNYSYTPPATGITTSTASVKSTTSFLSSYTILSSFVVNSVTYTVNNIDSYAFSINVSTGYYPGNNLLTNVTLPNTITRISFGAFSNCTSLPSIELPSSLIRIEGDNLGVDFGPFYNCISLTSITINSTGALTVGNNIFKLVGVNRINPNINLILNAIPTFINAIINSFFSDSNTQITGINLTINSLGSIPDSSFLNLTKIKNITINNVTSIGNSTFQGCTALTTLTLSNSVSNIGQFAFTNCSTLNNITLPSSVTFCNDNAFYSCTNILTVTANSYLSNIFTIINNTNSALINTLNITYNTNIAECQFFNKSSLKNISFINNSSINTIGSSAFNYCSNLTNLSLPSTVVNIGDYAFANCSNLTNFTIPSGVTTLYKNNFVGLPSPYNVVIGNSSNINLLDQSSNIIWNNISINLLSNNSNIFSGYYNYSSSDSVKRFLTFYNKSDLNTNILTSINLNKSTNIFTGTSTTPDGGFIIDSIPALDAQYNASQWSITNTSNVLYYKTTTAGVWTALPNGTVSLSISQLYTNPIPSIDLPTISPICFLAGTPVLTDQGMFAIESIDINSQTINGNKIKAITKTVSLESELVLIKQNAIDINVPDKDTITTMNHEILYNNIMTKAKDLVNLVEGVSTIKNNNEYLYNVLLNKHSIMVVNNMIVETLHPDNIIATIYNNSINEDERNKLTLLLNNAVLTKDYNKYDEFFKLLKIC